MSPSPAITADDEKLSAAIASILPVSLDRSVAAMTVDGGMKSSRLSPASPSAETLAVIATDSTFCSDSWVSMLKERIDSISSPKRSMR